jgi:hypothetical protein
VAGRTLSPTPVFDTYWRFAAARQHVYMARIDGAPEPWTCDPVLARYRFTNAYRAADRVSQYLIRHVIYAPGAPEDPDDIVFRILLFKFFNKVSTWQALEAALGEVSWKSYNFVRYSGVLDEAAARGPIYSPAYVIPPPQMGEDYKRRNHLRLLEHMVMDGLGSAVTASGSLEGVYKALMSYRSMGRFLAFQFAIDLNYSTLMSSSEDEFVVPGPGAVDGIRKCFGPASRGVETEIIRYVTDTQQHHFERLGLRFGGLFGRPLHLVDCQNLFCEVDKYARIVHPEARGDSGRTRIKQGFRRSHDHVEAFFPPKWGLSVPQAREAGAAHWSPTLFSL